MNPCLRLACVLLVLAWSGSGLLTAQQKKEKSPLEGKKGTVLGKVTAKGDNFIEVKADGEEKARKYVPLWKGGMPANGGGFDKDVVKAIKELKVGSRVEVNWLFQERPRVLHIKLIKAAEKK